MSNSLKPPSLRVLNKYIGENYLIYLKLITIGYNLKHILYICNSVLSAVTFVMQKCRDSKVAKKSMLFEDFLFYTYRTSFYTYLETS